MAVFILMCVSVFLQLVILMLLVSQMLADRSAEADRVDRKVRREVARQSNKGRAHVDESGDFGEDARRILSLDRYSKEGRHNGER